MKLIKLLLSILIITLLNLNLFSKIKIGIVYDIGGRGDKSFNDYAYEGLIKLAKF